MATDALNVRKNSSLQSDTSIIALDVWLLFVISMATQHIQTLSAVKFLARVCAILA